MTRVVSEAFNYLLSLVALQNPERTTILRTAAHLDANCAALMSSIRRGSLSIQRMHE
jgi:hypothetical protein